MRKQNKTIQSKIVKDQQQDLSLYLGLAGSGSRIEKEGIDIYNGRKTTDLKYRNRS